MFNFLQYGTTAQVARATGAGRGRRRPEARRAGALALARRSASRSPSTVAAARRSRSSTLVGVEGQTADYAVTYLRIVSIGIPSFFLALGGQGFLRGVSELRAPLVVIVARRTCSTSCSRCCSSTASTGGSRARPGGPRSRSRAWASAFVWLIVRRVGRDDLAPVRRARPPPALGREVPLRPDRLADLPPSCSPGAVVARFGDAELGAYQISFQLWIFLALVLDAIAIAGPDHRRPRARRGTARAGVTPRACG